MNIVVLLSFKHKAVEPLCVKHLFAIEQGDSPTLTSAHVMSVIPKTRRSFFTITDCNLHFHIFGVHRWKLHPVLIKKQYEEDFYANNMLITDKHELYIAGCEFFAKYKLRFR